MVQYDEPILDLNGRPAAGIAFPKERCLTAVERVRRTLPANDGRKLLFSASSWLGSLLSGSPYIDKSSLAEFGLAEGETTLLDDIHIPEFQPLPWKPVGQISDEFAARLNINATAQIMGGASDSMALAYAAAKIGIFHLVYLGTFFSVLEIEPHLISQRSWEQPPYRWHISMPAGALIERLAGSLFPEERDTSARISRFIDAAQKHFHCDPGDLAVLYREWDLGVTSDEIPRITSSSYHKTGILCAAVIHAFTNSLRQYTAERAVTRIAVAGGLSVNANLVNMIESSCAASLHASGLWRAEGAACFTLS